MADQDDDKKKPGMFEAIMNMITPDVDAYENLPQKGTMPNPQPQQTPDPYLNTANVLLNKKRGY